MSGFGVYVHWPICAAKCPYCDFNSHVRSSFDETRWADGIARELAAVAGLQGRARPEVSSIFFGGGTPSLLSGKSVAAILDGIAGLWSIAPDVEITLEANPNSVEQGRFQDYRNAGVNRVSIGVQSFDDHALKALGRLHGAAEARTAISLARRVFPRVNFDLIYTRPEQSLASWEAELRDALSFETEHLSLYQLTIEQGTAYATLAKTGQLVLPVEDSAAEFYEVTQEICATAGLPAYEISNHAKTGGASRHNLIYWRYDDYAGVGPGAHGRLTISEHRLATQAERLPEKWLKAVETKGSSLTCSDVAPREAADEHLLMNLRLSEGIDMADYRARWGVAPAPARVDMLENVGLLRQERTRIVPTLRGRLVLNSLIADLASSMR